jgi:hypothetical protein
MTQTRDEHQVANGSPPPGHSMDKDALRSVKRGVIAMYVMAAMNAFLAWHIYDIGYGVNEAAGEDRTIIAVSTLLVALAAAGMAYWFGRLHHVAIPIIFLAWLGFEVAVKFVTGKPNVEYVVVSSLVTFGLISGLRGALALRKARA